MNNKYRFVKSKIKKFVDQIVYLKYFIYNINSVLISEIVFGFSFFLV